jgi:hypothetical protein
MLMFCENFNLLKEEKEKSFLKIKNFLKKSQDSLLKTCSKQKKSFQTYCYENIINEKLTFNQNEESIKQK